METFSALLALCAGNLPVSGEIPAQRPVTRSFDVVVDMRLIKPLSNTRKAGDFRRYCAHYDVIVMVPGHAMDNRGVHKGSVIASRFGGICDTTPRLADMIITLVKNALE